MIKALVICVLVAAVFGQDRYRYAPQYYRPGYYQPRYATNVADVDAVTRRVNLIDDQSPKPYSFSYSAPLDDGVGSSSRTEAADGSGRVEGSYTLTNDEGHTRVVEYIADEGGFRATVRTNEPGTSNQSPADVLLESTAPSHYDYSPEARHYHRPRPIAAAVVRNAAVEEPIVVEQPVVDAHVAPAVIPRHRNVLGHRPYYPAAYNRSPYYY